MKKLTVLLLVFTSSLTTPLLSQGGNHGKTRIPPAFLGWDGTGLAGDLQIRNDFAGQPINLLTGGVQRMTILGAPGFIGIGNGFLAPQSRLHLHQPGALPVFTQWTNGTTGNATANEGLGIGITAGGVVQIHQFENNSINFLTNAGPLHTLKFHIGHSAANLPR